MYRVLLASHLSDDQLADVDPPYPYDRAPVIVTDPGETASASSPTASASSPSPTIDLRAAAARLAPVADVADRLPALLGMAGGNGVGSNSFVVDGSRTTTGLPMLANDTHLGPSMPGIWYQVGLHCRTLSDACPFDVAGFSFSGFPGVVLGHNDRIAWGFTNLGPDVEDLYLEDVQGDRYQVDDRMLDLDIRTETIQVAGGDPVTIRIRSTQHGPLISDAERLLPMGGRTGRTVPRSRRARTRPLTSPWSGPPSPRAEPAEAVFLLNRARDFDDFRAAAEHFAVPSQNMIYADVDGHIGYQAPGVVPIRRTGDGKWPAPGWDPDYDVGWLRFRSRTCPGCSIRRTASSSRPTTRSPIPTTPSS